MNFRNKVTTLLIAFTAVASPSLWAEPIVGNEYTLVSTNDYSRTNLIANLHNQSKDSIAELAPTDVAMIPMLNIANVTTGQQFDPGLGIEAFCVDIFNWLKPSFNYTYTTGDSYFAEDNTVEALARLATNHLHQIVDADSSAAFQFAVWEIVNETSGTWNINNGSFYASSFAASNIAIAASLANQWLSSNSGEINRSEVFVYNSAGTTDRSQSLVVFKVPEPASMALIAIGLFALSILSRRKPARDQKVLA